jgi:hypothetical protein
VAIDGGKFRGYRHKNGNIAGYGVLRELGLLLLYYTAYYREVARGGGQVNGWERTLVYLGLKRRRRVLWQVDEPDEESGAGGVAMVDG